MCILLVIYIFLDLINERWMEHFKVIYNVLCYTFLLVFVSEYELKSQLIAV